MKKIISIFLIFTALFLLTACSNGNTEVISEVGKVKKIINSMEYSTYMNVFGEEEAYGYTNQTYTKEGIFTMLYDSFNGRTRYYVWGYSDKTLCCDWQWEFVPQSTDDLPRIGAHVKVTGTLVKNENALDSYWLEEATVQTVTGFVSMYGDYDLTTMSPTLARVQVMNMINYTSEYNGKAIKVYGRVTQGGMIQHPYYDNAWSLPLEYDKVIPSIGTYITVTGTFSGTSYDNSKIVVKSIEIDR